MTAGIAELRSHIGSQPLKLTRLAVQLYKLRPHHLYPALQGKLPSRCFSISAKISLSESPSLADTDEFSNSDMFWPEELVRIASALERRLWIEQAEPHIEAYRFAGKTGPDCKFRDQHKVLTM